jgi:hypothetical protein
VGRTSARSTSPCEFATRKPEVAALLLVALLLATSDITNSL